MHIKNILGKISESRALGAAKGSLKEDINLVRSQLGIIVEPTNVAIRGGLSIYVLKDALDGTILGEVELGRTDYYPGQDNLYHSGEAVEKVADMAKAGKGTLKALVESRKTFYDDRKKVEAATGISFYVPNALPISERTKKGEHGLEQSVYVHTEEYSLRGGRAWYSSSEPLDAGILWVGVTETIPGIHSYPEASRYWRGQFMETFLADPAMVEAYLARVNSNAANISPGTIRGINWKTLSKDLQEDRDGTLASFRNLEAIAGKYVVNRG